MIETLSVVAIVSLAVALAGRSLYRTLTGVNDACGGCTGGCPGCGGEDLAAALRRQETKK